MDTKQCSRCGETKALSAFGAHAYCRECNRKYQRERRKANPEKFRAYDRARYARDPERKKRANRRWAIKNWDRVLANNRANHIMRRYGLTIEEYEAAMAVGCAICGASADERTLGMDHDHSNGKARSALCSQCNSALGYMGDDPSLLRAAADYLDAHQ